MPATLTYPGVYIQEITSGSHHHRRQHLGDGVHRRGQARAD